MLAGVGHLKWWPFEYRSLERCPTPLRLCLKNRYMLVGVGHLKPGFKQDGLYICLTSEETKDITDN